MARPAYGGRQICESCKSIDIRRWQREARLRDGQYFSSSWTRGGEPSGSITVRTEPKAVVLMFRSRSWQGSEWKSVEQFVPITWTDCHFGGRRPWFICSVGSDGRHCGRRVAVLYGLREYFACRRCHGLAYASQLESLRYRGFGKAQKIRIRLGGNGDIFDAFPYKPKGMHWRTYDRLRSAHDVAAARLTGGLIFTSAHKGMMQRHSRRPFL
jgi:hypothetical protein